MVVEYLAFDVATLYGENGHQLILNECFKEHEIHKTSINQKPYFVDHVVDFVYLGAMSEKYQQILNKNLLPYKQRIKELIENGVYFLVCGNGVDVFGHYVDYEDDGKIETLGLFDFYTVQRFRPRINCFMLGEYEGKKVTAHKTQFTQSYVLGGKQVPSFFKVTEGMGMNKQSKDEGIHYKNFFGTNCIGPFLALNPYFMENLFLTMNQNIPLPSSFNLMVEAYELRVKEFESGKVGHISL